MFTSDSSPSAYKVRIGLRLVQLNDYIKTKDKLTSDDIKQLMENIRDRNEYLSRFYDVSLKVPESLAIRDPPMKNNHLKSIL